MEEHKLVYITELLSLFLFLQGNLTQHFEFDRDEPQVQIPLTIDNNKIKIRLMHFSLWCLMGWCLCVEWQILPYIERHLKTNVYMFVYVIKKYDAEVSSSVSQLLV